MGIAVFSGRHTYTEPADMSQVDERTPLVGGRRASAAGQEQADANASAFFSGVALDPNASTFSRVGQVDTVAEEEDEETRLAPIISGPARKQLRRGTSPYSE